MRPKPILFSILTNCFTQVAQVTLRRKTQIRNSGAQSCSTRCQRLNLMRCLIQTCLARKCKKILETPQIINWFRLKFAIMMVSQPMSLQERAATAMTTAKQNPTNNLDSRRPLPVRSRARKETWTWQACAVIL
jgi:hypothetical protein